MKTRVVRVHVAPDGAECGIQFEYLEGDVVLSRQRGFVDIDEALLEPIREAAVAALAAKLAELPDTTPGAVTSALMRARNAQQEEEHARAARLEEEAKAEEASQAAQRAREEAEEAARAKASAEHQAAKIAEANERAAAALEETRTALAAERAEREELHAEVVALRAAKLVESEPEAKTEGKAER